MFFSQCVQIAGVGKPFGSVAKNEVQHLTGGPVQCRLDVEFWVRIILE